MRIATAARRWLQEREEEIETSIRNGRELRLAVARVLLQIHRRFFSADAPEQDRGALGTWEAYCECRWGFSRARGYQLLDLALVAEMLQAGDLTERQARALAGLEPDEAAEAYAAAGGDATAAEMAAAVEAIAQRRRRGSVAQDLGRRISRTTTGLLNLYRAPDLAGDGEAAARLIRASARLALGTPTPQDLQAAALIAEEDQANA